MAEQNATRLAEIAGREKAATPAGDPWSWRRFDARCATKGPDRTLMLHARADIPWLLARVAELEAELERRRAG
jgi:hypothetical protein